MDSSSVPSQMNSFYGDSMMASVGGERVKVALRVRPLMPHESSRGDDSIVAVQDQQHCLLSLKTGTKGFRFNAVLDEKTKQSEVFSGCGVHVIITTLITCCLGTDRFRFRGVFSYYIRLWLNRLGEDLHYVGCWRPPREGGLDSIRW